VMLSEPDYIDPERVGEPSLAQRFVDDDAVPFGIPAVGKQEIAEFHRALFRRKRSGVTAALTGLKWQRVGKITPFEAMAKKKPARIAPPQARPAPRPLKAKERPAHKGRVHRAKSRA
jgi:hypothetical protein